MDYLRQKRTPLFPNLMWSRPETRQGAGKLLIIGGQAQEFIHVAETYAASEKGGAGSIRVFMPDSTMKITKMLPNIEYAESNNSGSFARTALAELLAAAEWANAVLLSGDLGKNSETTLMLESFISKYNGQLTVTSNALSSLSFDITELYDRPNTCLVIDLNDLQKHGIALGLEQAITSRIGDLDLARVLHTITSTYPVIISLKHQNKIWCAHKQQVAVSECSPDYSVLNQAGRTAVWIMQHPTKPFEAAISAIFD